MLVRTLLLIILFLLLVRFVWRLARGVLEGVAGEAPPRGGGGTAHSPAVKMTQDPVCGTYVVPGKALELTRGRETLFFCSETCRQKYLEPK